MCFVVFASERVCTTCDSDVSSEIGSFVLIGSVIVLCVSFVGVSFVSVSFVCASAASSVCVCVMSVVCVSDVIFSSSECGEMFSACGLSVSGISRISCDASTIRCMFSAAIFFSSVCISPSALSFVSASFSFLRVVFSLLSGVCDFFLFSGVCDLSLRGVCVWRVERGRGRVCARENVWCSVCAVGVGVRVCVDNSDCMGDTECAVCECVVNVSEEECGECSRGNEGVLSSSPFVPTDTLSSSSLSFLSIIVLECVSLSLFLSLCVSLCGVCLPSMLSSLCCVMDGSSTIDAVCVCLRSAECLRVLLRARRRCAAIFSSACLFCFSSNAQKWRASVCSSSGGGAFALCMSAKERKPSWSLSCVPKSVCVSTASVCASVSGASTESAVAMSLPLMRPSSSQS